MQITDVRVRKVAKEGKLKAVVSITMDEEFVVHDIKVLEGEKDFIAMPSKRQWMENTGILLIQSIPNSRKDSKHHPRELRKSIRRDT